MEEDVLCPDVTCSASVGGPCPEEEGEKRESGTRRRGGWEVRLRCKVKTK